MAPPATTPEELLKRLGLGKNRKGAIPLTAKLLPSLRNKTETERELAAFVGLDNRIQLVLTCMEFRKVDVVVMVGSAIATHL